MSSPPPLTLDFVAGTLELRGLPSTELHPHLAWDGRSACFRAPAIAYADVVRMLHRNNLVCQDRARRYEVLDDGLRMRREPREYQAAALDAWRAARGRGVVVLPTGAGKTQVACMAIDDRRRSTLVVAPTLDLVRQWYDVLRATF